MQHNLKHNSTAVLLFAQSVTVASESKFLAPSKKQNLILWKTLNSKAVAIVEKTKVPYFISNENNQIGTSFGEKLTNAIDSVFQRGFDKVIVIGNDCPQLTSKKLINAIERLQKSDFVFGPDFNGGLYLTGVSKNSFCKEKFQAIPWQTNIVFEKITTTFALNSIDTLEKLNDVNSLDDLKTATSKLKFHSSLRNSILNLLLRNINLITLDCSISNQLLFHKLFNKGSPLFIYSACI
jgi:hypothetical protein